MAFFGSVFLKLLGIILFVQFVYGNFNSYLKCIFKIIVNLIFFCFFFSCSIKK